MRPGFDYGDEVRVMRNVRNDGTYPGLEMGAPLIKRGSVGYVQSVGTYLQDYIIYGVQFRDKVQATIKLAIDGDVLVQEADQGEVLKVLRDMPNGVHYHVRFPGRTLMVPEKALRAIDDETVS
jgi:nitrogen fixation protein NifZ